MQLPDDTAHVEMNLAHLNQDYITEAAEGEASFLKLVLGEVGLQRELDVCGYIGNDSDCADALEQQFAAFED